MVKITGTGFFSKTCAALNEKELRTILIHLSRATFTAIDFFMCLPLRELASWVEDAKEVVEKSAPQG